MRSDDLSHRAIKRRVREVLLKEDFNAAMVALDTFPARRVVNPLISFFCSGNAQVRWRAISGMGVVVSRLAETDLESARVVMRRLMWTLNDESGGIGWGAPEAMGEITARHSRLADEFGCILISYIRPDCNFLEHPVLQRGVLWGVGRLAHARPSLVADVVPFIIPFIESPDAFHRGHAAWLMRALAETHPCDACEALTADKARFLFYFDGHLSEVSVADAAHGSLPPSR